MCELRLITVLCSLMLKEVPNAAVRLSSQLEYQDVNLRSVHAYCKICTRFFKTERHAMQAVMTSCEYTMDSIEF